MSDLTDLAQAADQTMHRPTRLRGLPCVRVDISPGQAFGWGFFAAIGAWFAWLVLTVVLLVIVFVMHLWPFSGR